MNCESGRPGAATVRARGEESKKEKVTNSDISRVHPDHPR